MCRHHWFVCGLRLVCGVGAMLQGAAAQSFSAQRRERMEEAQRHQQERLHESQRSAAANDAETLVVTGDVNQAHQMATASLMNWMN